MCLWLNNPPAPSCEPTTGYIDEKTGMKCGNCVCVPKYWLLIAPLTADPYMNLFLGRQVLSRDVAAFQQSFSQQCQWQIRIDLTPAGYTQIGSTTLYFDGNDWLVQFLGGVPPDPLQPDVANYSLHAFGQPDTRPFRCLKPNIFYLDNLTGSGNFPDLPDSITLQPFWA